MKRAIITLILTLTLTSTLTSNTHPIKTKTLKNGLKVLLIQDPNAELASARIIVKAGSITEGSKLGHGMSHYLEHLVHSGTTSVRPEKAYQNALADLGGASNAYTTHDHTAYFIDTTNNKLTEAITLLYEWMFKSTFTEAEFRRERTVIHKEMERAHADIANQFYHQIQKNFYPKHPVRHPVLGYKSQFDTLTTTDLHPTMTIGMSLKT